MCGSIGTDELDFVVGSGTKPCKRHRRNSIGLADTTEAGPDRVLIWDLDETIIVFQTLITGVFAETYNKDRALLAQLAYRMEEIILYLADTHFFFNEIEVSALTPNIIIMSNR